MSEERKRELVEYILDNVPEKDKKKDRAILEEMDVDGLKVFSDTISQAHKRKEMFWALFKKNLGLKD